MRWTYSCPACDAMLNPDQNVILVGQLGATRALMGFHPEPGNYQVYLPPGLEVADGERWSFSCPVCHHDLAIWPDGDLCALVVHTATTTRRLLFSRVAGVQATFVVGEGGETERHGRDADRHWSAVAQLKYVLEPGR